ncbi:hypothetical protein [Mycobacteroides abscessus]|uniref:hypothetical protein n=1 Tax=Mycobacteroides abscessus TaxID=36809 RepID=UPI0009CA57DA|nr:hypothetical protein [Mycobacteroides abscessus]SKT79080.1 Uncharacterised protein [Mycobacteroides abscessus subsp. massiliense]SKU02809.1 Uncharacterised protein [Mycobacteroides abscessus subsp. massiliense]
MLLLLYAAAAVGAVFVLLSPASSSASYREALIAAGSAGAAATSLATIPRFRGDFASPAGGAAEDGTAPGLLLVSTLIPPLSGFAAGAFSLLVGMVLLTGNRPTEAASAAVYGGLFGLMLAGSAQSLLGPQQLLDGVQTAMGGLGLRRELQSARYSGRVVARLQNAGESGLVAAKLVVAFLPERAYSRGIFRRQGKWAVDVDKPVEDRSSPGESRKSEIGYGVGQIIVEDGQKLSRAEFVVTVVPGTGYESLPKSRIVTIPSREPSIDYEFTIVRRSDESRPAHVRGKPQVVVDVAQRGRTICLLQPGASGREAESAPSVYTPDC